MNYNVYAKIFTLFIFVMICRSLEAWYHPDKTENNDNINPVGLIVKFKPDVSLLITADKNGATQINIESINRLIKDYSVTSITTLDRSAMSLTDDHPLNRTYTIHTADKSDINQLKSDLEELDEVLWVEPDYLAEFHTVPDDEYYSHLWSLHNYGQGHYAIERRGEPGDDKLVIRYGLDDADIDQTDMPYLEPDKTHSVVVAIIDTGYDFDHPELSGKAWSNEAEIPGNNKDDDHNGYIDDIHGWDFSGSIGSPKIEDNDPTDNFGHGTHISGTIAAGTNNEIGVAGIIPHCSIMPLKIHPWSLTSKIARAIIYATDNQADVINMSFGLPYKSALIDAALEYAHMRGVVMCTSSGNDGIEGESYPAESELTIAVGATNDRDLVTSFSTFGQFLDLSAPGEAILSLRAAGTDMFAEGRSPEPDVHIVDDLYYISSGTSMSCPHVAAAAAWLRSKSPGLNPETVRNLLNDYADDILDPYGNDENYPGYDIYSGFGRLNLAASLTNAPSNIARIDSPRPHKILSGDVTIAGTASGETFAGYQLRYGVGSVPEEWIVINNSFDPVVDGELGVWNTAMLSPGAYTIQLLVSPNNTASTVVHVGQEYTCNILSPSDTSNVAQIVDVYGELSGPDFDRGVLEYGIGETPAEWFPLTEITSPIYDELLTSWYIDNPNQTVLKLKLSLYSSTGLEKADTILIHVISLLESENAWKAPLYALPSIVANYGDYDGDGTNEIFVGTDSGLVVLSPDGLTRTVDMPDFPENKYYSPVAIGDGNGDGIDDIAVIGYDPPTLYYYSIASDSFIYKIPEDLLTGGQVISEATASVVFFRDVDNDGHDEIHLSAFGGSNSNIFVFNSIGSLLINIPDVTNYLSCDLDGNGQDEMYTYESGSGKLKQVGLDGIAVDSIYIFEDGAGMIGRGMSACDVDLDGKHELILNGSFQTLGHRIYAFNHDLSNVPGWPHIIDLDNFLSPTVPVFADIDGDDAPEYFTGYFDFTESFIMGWHLDGTPFITDGTDGHFIKVLHPALLNMLTIADIDGDNMADIITRANNDLLSSFNLQRLYAWDNTARMIDLFPVVLSEKDFVTTRYSPTIGDIDKDGFVDLIIPGDDSTLAFINFSDRTYDSENCPVPIWRYNKRLNNLAPINDGIVITDIDDDLEPSIPDRFILMQNSPNPFNPTTVINYFLPTRSEMKLEVFNILGRKVRTLVDGTKAAGTHSLFFDGKSDDGTSLSSGVYLYRLQTGDFVDTKKMILLK